MRGIFSKLNISKALITRGLSLVVVFATLVAAYAALSMNHTLGWFAKNETVSANGMITQAYTSTFKVTYRQVILTRDDTGKVTGKTYVNDATIDPNNILANVKVPGQSVAYEITIQNTGIYPVQLTGFGLEAPAAGGDIPKIVDGTGYYLSTELTTQLVMQGDTVVETSTPYRLRNKEDGTSVRINYLSEDIELEPQESMAFTIEISFEDNGEDQNVYKNFGEDGTTASGKCVRRIFMTYDE